MRIFAWSDLHADFARNRELISAVPRERHRDDALIVAGDVSDRMETLAAALAGLRERFAEVFFVPGNHEAWVRGGGYADSPRKLAAIDELCGRLEVRTRRLRLGQGDAAVWVVPLLSWYERPEEGADSLYVAKATEAVGELIWGDDLFTRWPEGEGQSRRLLRENEDSVAAGYDAPVVSFSHFLPRRDLMMRTPEERLALGAGQPDRAPTFNFSRVAGSAGIDRQVRAIGSRVHVYGHQHRNRDRLVEGVRYVSHCLGYPGEGAAEDALRPKLVWGVGEGGG